MQISVSMPSNLAARRKNKKSREEKSKKNYFSIVKKNKKIKNRSVKFSTKKKDRKRKNKHGKYVKAVLYSINEEHARSEEKYLLSLKKSAFDVLLVRSVWIEDIPQKYIITACIAEWKNNILPCLTYEKFSDIEPKRLSLWLKLSTEEMIEEDKQSIYRNLNWFFAKTNTQKVVNRISAMQKLVLERPKLLVWTSTDYGFDLKFEETPCYTIEEMENLYKLQMENNLYFLRTFDRLIEAANKDTTFARKYSMSNLCYGLSEVEHRACECSDCGNRLWDCNVIGFECFDEDSTCAKTHLCSNCVSKRIISNHSDDNVKGCFTCGKECGCLLKCYSSSNGVHEFFQKAMKKSPAEIDSIYLQDYELLVFSRIRNLVLEVKRDPKTYDDERNDSHENFLPQTPLQTAYNSAICSFPAETKTEIDALFQKIDNYIVMDRLQEKFDVLNTQIESLISLRDIPEKNSEQMLYEMFEACIELVPPILDILRNRPTRNDTCDELFGLSLNDIVNMKLQRAKDTIVSVYSRVNACSICMIASDPSEEKLLQLHNGKFESDVKDWKIGDDIGRPHFQLPCFACVDCMKSYLKFKSALGKPRLQCPGMNCGCRIPMREFKNILPTAYANYKGALMKFALKKVSDFKTCPIADCGAGIVVDICNVDKISCPQCTTSFCPNCNDVPHPGKTCEELRKERHIERWGDENGFMEAETKQCPHCLTFIEKNGGCNHMTCHHCRGEFCWLCFGDWSTHISCENKKEVVRRQFKELFASWQEKPPKTLKPRFNVGRWVEAFQSLGRVETVDENLLYTVRWESGLMEGTMKLEESQLRGYNGERPTIIDEEQHEELGYSNFLNGFEVEDSQSESYESVELVLKDLKPKKSEVHCPRAAAKIISERRNLNFKQLCLDRAQRELIRESQFCSWKSGSKRKEFVEDDEDEQPWQKLLGLSVGSGQSGA